MDVEKTQVFSISLDGKDTVQITDSKTSVSQYEMNPGKKELAYVAEEYQGEKDTLNDLGFNQDVFEENIPDRNLYLQNLESGEVEQLTEDENVFDFVWNHGGTQIAAAIAIKNTVDHSYMFKRIHLVDPETKEVTKLVDNPGKLGQMAWSPDDSKLTFVSAAHKNDAVSGSLFMVDVDDPKKFDNLKNYTKPYKISVTSVVWKDNNTMLFSAEEGVNSVLSEQSIDKDTRNILLEGGKVVLTSFSKQGDLIAFTGDTKNHPNELYTFSMAGNELTRLTNHNEWIEDKKFGKQEKITYNARDGLKIEGVLIYPVNYEEGKSYPLITMIHGGPEAAIMNGWQTYYSRWGQVAAGKGYFVFMPNYRASSGRGTGYTMRGFGDLAGKEFTDVIDGIDYLIEEGMVDKEKVGIGGGSYGGYFSNWAATKRSERFAAAVSFVGVSDQISKRFETDIPKEDYLVHWGMWTHEDPMLVYDRSPVKYAKNNETPLLILHGTKDPRVDPSQSLEMYRAVKLHGKASVRLIWYPGEGHGNRLNPYRLDYSLRTMRWFDYYLKSDKPKDQKPEDKLEYDKEFLGIE